ncbi:hypothetical protein ACFSTD_06595 [Novosphingobium colocasiae]
MTESSDLLSALHPEDIAALRAHMAPCRLTSGAVIFEPGDNVEWCYFPLGGTLCSYFVLLDSGIAVETIMVGREGALGGSSATAICLPSPAPTCFTAAMR